MVASWWACGFALSFPFRCKIDRYESQDVDRGGGGKARFLSCTKTECRWSGGNCKALVMDCYIGDLRLVDLWGRLRAERPSPRPELDS